MILQLLKLMENQVILAQTEEEMMISTHLKEKNIKLY